MSPFARDRFQCLIASFRFGFRSDSIGFIAGRRTALSVAGLGAGCQRAVRRRRPLKVTLHAAEPDTDRAAMPPPPATVHRHTAPPPPPPGHPFSARYFCTGGDGPAGATVSVDHLAAVPTLLLLPVLSLHAARR